MAAGVSQKWSLCKYSEDTQGHCQRLVEIERTEKKENFQEPLLLFLVNQIADLVAVQNYSEAWRVHHYTGGGFPRADSELGLPPHRERRKRDIDRIAAPVGLSPIVELLVA